MVSCTRSSASEGFPVRRSATRYRTSRWTRASRSKLARLSSRGTGDEAGGTGLDSAMVFLKAHVVPQVPQWGRGCYVSRSVVHSIVPLAVLEAVKNLDTPVEDGLTEFAEELLVKRLGLSPTVEMQLAEYELLARKDARVEPSHVEALLRLVGRRPRSAQPMTPLEGFDFAALRELLGSLPADAWLLYDFRGINPAATRVLGIHGMGTRRFFVLLPRDGQPVALAHRIELAAF